MLHDLRKITYLHIIRNSNLSVCRTLKATYEFQNRRLSCSVLSYKADLVILADMKIDVIQQDKAAIGHCKTVYRYHILFFNCFYTLFTNQNTEFVQQIQRHGHYQKRERISRRRNQSSQDKDCTYCMSSERLKGFLGQHSH